MPCGCQEARWWVEKGGPCQALSGSVLRLYPSPSLRGSVSLARTPTGRGFPTVGKLSTLTQRTDEQMAVSKSRANDDPTHHTEVQSAEPQALHQARRCGARTRSGRPCQSPSGSRPTAVPDAWLCTRRTSLSIKPVLPCPCDAGRRLAGAHRQRASQESLTGASELTRKDGRGRCRHPA